MKHIVHVPESSLAHGRRKFTAAQFLAEHKVRDPGEPPSRAFDLRPPITVRWTTRDRGPANQECVTKAARLFALIAEVAGAHGVILSVSCSAWHLGPVGLFFLNRALYTYPHRQGGRNIVRCFVEDHPRIRVPLSGTFLDLLAFLEIRPVSRVKRPISTSLTTSPISVPPAPNAIRYVHSRIGHKVKDLKGRKRRPSASR